MNAYSNLLVYITIFCETIAVLHANDYPLNVGTVLFSSSDLNKRRWSKTEIGLLRARRYFQSVLPPPDVINNLHEDYVDMLLDYFRDAFASIKTEAKDPEADRIMTTALSDAIGGYLKVWVLPVTKFAFYGGSVSQENALKLFRFYKEMKNYMKTDGKGWRDPDPNLLSTVAINIVQPKHTSQSSVRSMDSPCEHLGYFLKTPSGLSIPVPHVNWDDQSSTMFLPLKNQTLIPLESPSSSNTLFNYYDIAKNCMQESGQDEQNQFDERFQTWLGDEVVPHLNDDNLYLALGSVLTLVNTTRSLYDSVIDLYDNVNKSRSRLCIAGFPIDLSSRKTMIITVILFLEIAWCIPALLYIMCNKKRKKDFGSNVYLFVEPSENKKEDPKEKKKIAKQGTRGKKQRKVCESTSRVETSGCPTNNQGFKLSSKPRRNVDTNCSSVKQNTIGTEAQSFLNVKHYSAEVARVVYDSPKISLKPSLKKMTAQSVHTITADTLINSSSRGACDYSSANGSIDPSESYDTVQELEPTKTVTLIRENEKTNRKHINKHKRISVREYKKASVDVRQNKEINPCACITCFKNDYGMKIIEEQQSTKTNRICISKTCSNKKTETNSKLTRSQVQEEIKISRNRGLKITSGKPYVEITIDRPQTEISVGISGMTRNDILETNKPSRIPKRSCNNAVHTSDMSSKKTQHIPPERLFKHKSRIPQPRSRNVTVDDIVIKNRGTSMKDDKLNVTL